MVRTEKPHEMEIFNNPNLFQRQKNQKDKIFYRVFGYWECADKNGKGCHAEWPSALTWVLLEKCQDNTSSELLLDNGDYWQQACKKCKSEPNVLVRIKALEEGESEPHKKELCEKCKTGDYCNKATVIKCFGYGYGMYVCNNCKNGGKCRNSLENQDIKAKIKNSVSHRGNTWSKTQHRLFAQQMVEPLANVHNLPLADQQDIDVWIRDWINNGFTYVQVQEWAYSLNVLNFDLDDANFCAWLQDTKKFSSSDLIINNENVNELRNLRKEYRKWRKIQIPRKKQELEQLTNNLKNNLGSSGKYLLEKLLKKQEKILKTNESSDKLEIIKQVLREDLNNPDSLQNLLNKQTELFNLEKCVWQQDQSLTAQIEIN